MEFYEIILDTDTGLWLDTDMNTTQNNTTFAALNDAVLARVAARVRAGMTQAEAVADMARFLRNEAARNASLDHFAATGEWLDSLD